MADSSSDEHYFSADPSVPFRRMPVTASVWGHSLSLDSGSGVFAQGRLDIGTAVLFRETSAPAPGRILDLGCGYGVIGLAIAVAVPGATVTGVDVNERAVLLANENAATPRPGRPVHARPPRPAYRPRRRTTSSGRTPRSGSARRRSTSCCSPGCRGWCPAAGRCWSSARTSAPTRCSAGSASRATRPRELRVRRGSGCWRLSARDHSLGGPRLAGRRRGLGRRRGWVSSVARASETWSSRTCAAGRRRCGCRRRRGPSGSRRTPRSSVTR